MVKEFLSLLKIGKEQIYETLKPQVHESVLKYLLGGLFDQDQKRIVAFALMPVNEDFFWKYDYILNFSDGYSAQLFGMPSGGEEEQGTISRPPDKSIEDQIKDGFYHYNLISFYGVYDFNEWNILTSCCFTNTKRKNQILERELRTLNGDIKNYFLNNSIFEETREHFEKQNEFLKKYYKEHKNPIYRNREIEMHISSSYKPFIGHSYLVALIRLKKKRVINEAYVNYLQKAIFDPLIVKLKTFYPNEYHRTEFQPYNNFTLFPDHKRYCMFSLFIIDKEKNTRLQFFVYLQQNGVIYEWTYFPSSIHKDCKVDLFNIHKIFEPISQVLDSHDYLTNPECTLDDDSFWNNYVLKKENNRYLYLKEVEFIN